ncbi:MAG: response regulator [Methylobacter sp.]
MQTKHSIKFKLIFITAFSSVVALLAFSAIVFFYEMKFAERSLINNLQTQADIIIENSQAGLAFMDKSSTEKTLGALKYNADILYAGLYDETQTLLASYHKPSYDVTVPLPPEISATGAALIKNDDFVQIIQPVRLDKELLGYLLLRGSFESFHQKLYSYLYTVLLAFSIALLIALLLSLRLQRIVSKPIIHMAKFINGVAESKTYKERAVRETNDELGVLVNAFNQMLEQLDFSLQKRDEAEQALAHHLEHLQETIDEQTRDLQDAVTIAEAANRAKSDFLANMSHEIRTPMNAIIGMTHLAQCAEPSPKQQGYLAKIDSAAQSLLNIINDILDFSKIEAGRLDLEHSPFYLDDLLGGLADLVGFNAEEKGLEIIFSVAPEVPRYLLGDSLRLGQVLLNLTNNAVKFTDCGEILISVSVESQDDAQCRLLFAIRDSGIGMTQQQIQGLFKAFSQADSSITRLFGGTGLGLAICRQLVGMMDGDISVESAEGQGSTFRFSVSLGVAPAFVAVSEPVRLDFSGKSTLVVDDNDIAREILSTTLTSLGFAVETAASGIEALACVDKRRQAGQSFDLVLMDWRMPGMDGIETAARIKSDTHLTKIPAVLMISAFGRDDLARQAHEIGVDGFLLKPIMEAALVNTIGLLLGLTAPEPMPQKQPAAEKISFQGRRVLLVEDNAFNRDVAIEMLQALDLKVDYAVNGQDGIDVLNRDTTYDLVLMDIQMPIMDGLKATRLIRANPRFAELPIIAMTAHAMPEDREKSLVAGMNDHVTKPINPRQLTVLLQHWLGSKATRESAPPTPEPDNADTRPQPLDINKALQFADHDEDKMHNRLLNFYACYQAVPTQLDSMIVNNDHDGLRRMAHTLKSASGYIGAARLQLAATQCWNHKEFTEPFAALLRQELQAVLTAILPYKPEQAAQPSAVEVPAAFAATLGQLEALICTGDARASVTLAELETAISGHPLSSELAAIRDAFDELDIDLALSRLAALREAYTSKGAPS